jgi:Dolichyl-phosphate-mannose-protein mannosyltransferase
MWHTDEKIDPSVHMIHEHTLDPDYFINPHLHIYAMAAVVKAAYILNPGHTVMLSMRRTWPLLDPSNPGRRIQYMAMRGSRILSALFSLGTIITIFAIGRRHFGEQTGLLAAGFLALTMGLVNLSHFATPESLLFLFMTLCLWACDRIATSGQIRDYALVGVFAGLALATKYTAWILAVPILVAHTYRLRRDVWKWRTVAGPLVCGVVGFVAFAVTNPYAFIRWSDFWYWGFVFNWYTGAPTGSLVGIRRSYIPYFWLLVDIMGWPLFVSGGASIVLASLWLWRGVRGSPADRAFAIHVSWVVAFYAFYGMSPHHALRFIMPVTPSLALLAAAAAVTLHATARAPWQRRLVSGWVAIVIVYSAVYTMRADWMYFHDTRYTAGRWLESHRYSQTQRLHYFEGEAYLPYFDQAFPLKFWPFMDDVGTFPEKRFAPLAAAMLASESDPIVDSNFYWERYTDRPALFPERSGFYHRLLDGTDPSGYAPVARFRLDNPWWLDPRPERIAPEVVVFGKPALLKALGGRVVERIER